MLHESQVLERQSISLDVMNEMKIVGEPVPGDGNCALWSILAQEHGEPICLNGGKKIQKQIPLAHVRALRKDSLYIFESFYIFLILVRVILL